MRPIQLARKSVAPKLAGPYQKASTQVPNRPSIPFTVRLGERVDDKYGDSGDQRESKRARQIPRRSLSGRPLQKGSAPFDQHTQEHGGHQRDAFHGRQNRDARAEKGEAQKIKRRCDPHSDPGAHGNDEAVMQRPSPRPGQHPAHQAAAD